MTHRSTNEMQLWMPKVELFVWPKIWMNLYQCKHVFSLMSGESWTSSQLKLGPSLSWLYRYTFDPSVWWSLDNFHLVAIWSLPLPGAFYSQVKGRTLSWCGCQASFSTFLRLIPCWCCYQASSRYAPEFIPLWTQWPMMGKGPKIRQPNKLHQSFPL